MNESTHGPANTSMSPPGDLLLTVRARELVADGIIALTLADADGARLPDWTPGSHVTLRLTDELSREYSLCGDRRDPSSYRIAVQSEECGHGGSAWVHAHLRQGALVRVSRPRNTFRLTPADEYLFVAGGVGITPLVSMIAAATEIGIPWRLLYLGHERARMAFATHLAALGDRVDIRVSADSGRCDLRRAVGTHRPGRKVLACGPTSLLDELAQITHDWPAGDYRCERFTAALPAPARTEPFDVVLGTNGPRVRVPTGQSVLEAINSAGAGVLFSCAEGVCGTCEMTVLAGTPDHRDSVMDDAERAAGSCFFPCVSRALSDELVLEP